MYVAIIIYVLGYVAFNILSMWRHRLINNRRLNLATSALTEAQLLEVISSGRLYTWKSDVIAAVALLIWPAYFVGGLYTSIKEAVSK